MRRSWRVGVSLGSGGAALAFDGRRVAADPGLAVEPWSLALTTGFLGRGLEGGWFRGSVTDVRFRCTPDLP